MKVNTHQLKKIIDLFLLLILFLFLTTNFTKAANLSASGYEINLNIDSPQQVFSTNIDLGLINREEELPLKNIYLEKFILKSAEGKEIPANYIKIETPYFQDTMDQSYRYLLMKKDQVKSWFKIGLLSKTVYLDPGIYKGFINIDDLDWEIMVKVTIEPFVKLNLDEKNIEFSVNNPRETDFFIAPKLYELNIDYNHTDWEVQACLENEFESDKGEILAAKNLFYRLENLNQKTDLLKLNKDQFKNFQTEYSLILINGKEYQEGLNSIRFGIDLTGEESSVQPAGFYSGNIIFTLRILDNNL
ncbi:MULTISPECIES: hypothetical protein [Halanaerobium]|uniref:Uncharacterized protein n=1 Tax=Halanaerobium kushneri TaxID=56779 RepID=A0A1N7BP63_9FIRM|nr:MULTISPECIES: hypothetical protein [Halanaerobium]RCW52330.1 hypothetical protein DFR80_13022 [Halanaerobium sp. ST460_2HS_T2]SIR53179.1 hypothetical protein SAMN05421834_13319 [Halanaerobium kushneri]